MNKHALIYSNINGQKGGLQMYVFMFYAPGTGAKLPESNIETKINFEGRKKDGIKKIESVFKI